MLKDHAKTFLAPLDPTFWVRCARAGWSDAMRRRVRAIGVVHPFGPVRVERAVELLPAVKLAEIAGQSSPVTIDARHAYRDGAAPVTDLLAIAMLAGVHAPAVVLEIGTFDGSTTRTLALTLPDAHVHTLDLPPVGDATATLSAGGAGSIDDQHLVASRRLGAAFRETPEAARITQHLGDSATYDLAGLVPGGVTFFYIDGAHTYEYVRSDTLRCMAIAAGESGFLWHDVNFTHEGVVAWIAQLADAGLAVRKIADTNLAYLRCTPMPELIARLTALPPRPTL